MKKIITYLLSHKWETFFVLVVLSIAGIAHGFNMFHYPYYESDEGTYMSQAWSFLTQAKLAPYTYWYDHAPVGWMFIAIWLFITKGLFTFGFAINSGRVLMLILHVLSTLFVYIIAKKLTGSKMTGIVAGLLFSLTPLGIYFQRRVLLDNIMMFWVFLSLITILYNNAKLRWITASSIFFGIAILSKESAIFFLPLFAYLVYAESAKNHRLFAVTQWLSISLSIVGFYFLYAFFKNELFPTGTLLGGTQDHVSLLGTLDFQASRGKVSIFDASSTFQSMIQTWMRDDYLFVVLGVFASIFTLLVGIKDRGTRIIALFTASYWAFLLRGGLVLEFYVVPLIPLMALSIAASVNQINSFLRSHLRPTFLKNAGYLVWIFPVLLCIYTVGITSFTFRGKSSVYTSDQTTAQTNAVDYILSKNYPRDFYAIDNYAYLDLNFRNNNNFKNAEYYWKVDGDKDIKTKILKDNPLNIDYVLFTPLIGGDLGTGEIPMIGTALANSNPITSFPGDGWYVQIWGVKNSNRILTSSWETYKKQFMQNGRVMDPVDNNNTSSEGQSYALLRSVWVNDQKTFDTTYAWTKDHLIKADNSIAWKWVGSDTNGKILDDGNATDADQDIALSLLFAYKRWNNPQYLSEAKSILSNLWDKNVVTIKKKPYIIAGKWANKSNEIIVNPSYLSPAWYKIFAEADKQHDWLGVTTSSYEVLTLCSFSPLDKNKGVLPPEWCAINKSSVKASQPTEKGLASTEYAYNAYRTPWRVALDSIWFNDSRSKTYVSKLDTLGKEWKENQKISTAYTHDGKVWEAYESVSAYSGALGYFKLVDPNTATTIYKEKIEKKFFEDKNGSYWDDPKNYFTQNWAWFGTALYMDSLPNLWKLSISK